MSYSRPGPSEHAKLKTLGEVIEVMAIAGKDAILRMDMVENQIKVKLWYTNGDYRGDCYYTIPHKIADKLISMTDGTQQFGERRLSQHHRDQYYEGLHQAREIRKAEADAALAEALYQNGIKDANKGLGE